MFINPEVAISEGWVTFPDWMSAEFKTKCIQPNALDITLDKVFQLDAEADFKLSENDKTMRRSAVLPPSGPGNYWHLTNGVYDGVSDFFVNVPNGVAALLIVRSTLNRNGLFITSGIYDSGYSGHFGFALHNRSGSAYIAPNTRVCQVAFVKSDDSSVLYAGGYNHTAGEHWNTQTTLNQ